MKTNTDTKAPETNTKPRVRWGQGGGLINRLQEATTAPVPTVGMGGTTMSYSDRHPVTVVSVGPLNKKSPAGRIGVQEDHAKRIDGNGMSECQDYEFTPNPKAPIVFYTIRKTGQYIREGESLKNGQVVVLGYRDKYHDFSF